MPLPRFVQLYLKQLWSAVSQQNLKQLWSAEGQQNLKQLWPADGRSGAVSRLAAPVGRRIELPVSPLVRRGLRSGTPQPALPVMSEMRLSPTSERLARWSTSCLLVWLPA